MLVGSLEGYLYGGPVVVGHGEDEDEEDECVEDGSEKESVFKDLMCFELLSFDECLLMFVFLFG